MNEYKKQEKFIIHSYKHNGNIHREWDEAILLDEKDEYLVFGNDKTKVLESDGRSWRTREPAVMFFYKKKMRKNVLILHFMRYGIGSRLQDLLT